MFPDHTSYKDAGVYGFILQLADLRKTPSGVSKPEDAQEAETKGGARPDQRVTMTEAGAENGEKAKSAIAFNSGCGKRTKAKSEVAEVE